MNTAFHGISAYRGAKAPRDLRKNVITALTGVELCSADRPIGACGMVIFGETRRVFERDVWSEIDHGERVFSSYGRGDDELAYLDSPTQQELEAFCGEYAKGHHYCELWQRCHILRALWVKPWVSSTMLKAMKIMADNRGVPLLVLEGTDRIWDVLDSETLPFVVAA